MLFLLTCKLFRINRKNALKFVTNLILLSTFDLYTVVTLSFYPVYLSTILVIGALNSVA